MKVVSIDSLEHAQLVLRSMRSSSSSSSRYQTSSQNVASLVKFDEMVLQASSSLSDKKKLDAHMEVLLRQQPPSPASYKELDTPYELSPSKEASMFNTGPRHKHKSNYYNNNNEEEQEEDDGVDFSSDDEEQGSRSNKGKKMERVALNRPPRGRPSREDGQELISSNSIHSPSNSFYDEQETFESDDDNDALFEGFTAPTVSHEPLSASQRPAAPLRSSVASSLSISTVPPAAPMKISKASSVASSQTLQELPRGVVVSKGGIFVRAGGRKKRDPAINA